MVRYIPRFCVWKEEGKERKKERKKKACTACTSNKVHTLTEYYKQLTVVRWRVERTTATTEKKATTTTERWCVS
jgi:hypothetical protein